MALTGQAQSPPVIVSAATYGGASFAPEQIVSAFGSGLSLSQGAASGIPLPTSLGGIKVKVTDRLKAERLAPLFYVSPYQINFQIPPGIAAGAATVTVFTTTRTLAAASIQIAPVAPGLFSADGRGRGLAAAHVIRQRGSSQTSEAVGSFDAARGEFAPMPVDLGPETDEVFLVLYGTGLRNHGGLATLHATVGGVPVEVTYAGAQGTFVGLDQVNLRLPHSLTDGGLLDVILNFGGQSTNAVQIALIARATETLYLATLRPEAGVMTLGSGVSSLRLSADEKWAVIKYTYGNLTTPDVAAHIHGPADPGTNGGILFDFDAAPRQSDGSYVWTFAPVGSLSVPQIVQALKAGRLYINVHSSRYPSGEIRGHYGFSSGSQAFTPPPARPALPGGNPTAKDAARFLLQATYGPKMSEITDLQGKGFQAWLDEQFAIAPASQMDLVEAALATGLPYNSNRTMDAFWRQALTGRDQLRQRVAFALSEIFVTSENSSPLQENAYGLSSYMDVLARNAFGNFRQLLEDVTLSPTMGVYLDMLRNDTEDPATGRNPNENYAREVLQLFSVGLYKLHPDGSLMLDADGLPIPTYDQGVVESFAKVFTGWAWGGVPATEAYWTGYSASGAAVWRTPMQAWASHHSAAQKRLLNGAVLPAGQTPQKDLQDALDNIFNHPNVGPFIARQLIQRLVTSNPSPGYVYHVASVFNDNGNGVRGDMKAVIRAILLDYEARSADVIGNQGYGKLREPVVRLAHLLRALSYTAQSGFFRLWHLESPEYALNQNPLRSPTVFNFFEPNYAQPGEIASAGLFSPEFQITTETSVIGVSNYMRAAAYREVNAGNGGPDQLRPDYSSLLPLALNPAQLVDHLNLLLMGGSMSSAMRTTVINAVAALPSSDPTGRVQAAVYLVITSPEGVVQK